MPIAIRAKQVLTRRQLLVRSASTVALAGAREPRQALSQPGRRPPADRQRNSIRRCIRGLRGGVGAGRPAGAHAGRVFDRRKLQDDYSRRIGRSVAGSRLYFQSAARGASVPAGYLLRVRFEDIGDAGISGETQTGHFRTAPAEQASVSFVWSGDTAGQGWGIDPSRGGMRTYRTMLENRPNFFIHSGDHIYADCPISAELKLPNGEIWRNIVTEEKSVVAHSLAQFRGNYKYNLLDDNLRAFNAQVPILAQWDDHEVTNDWSPVGSADETGYGEDGKSRLVERARRAFFEFMPIRSVPAQAGRIYRRIGYGPLLDVFLIDMRSYRDSTWNKRDDHSDTFILGPAQLAWL